MRRKINALVMITLCLGFLSVLNIHKGSSEETVNIFFNIDFLAPDSCGGSARYTQMALILGEILPKIGIGLDTYDHTGWAQITPRTWDYPGPFPIPIYDEGGYDVLFVGWSWDLDWDPIGLYDSPAICPNGDNFYQYSNLEMDWAIYNYTTSFILEDRLAYIKQIQALLYNDLPQITFYCPLGLYIMNADFDQSSWDGLLWFSAYQPMENWSCGSQTTFKYATPSPFEDFHPLLYESIYDAQWLSQIYNGMLERNALPPYYRGYSSRLADNWMSNDGLTYNFTIKENAMWADGTPITSYDVNYSYSLILNPSFNSPYYTDWIEFIDNNSISIIDEKHFTLTLIKNYFDQDNYLAIDLIPKHIWDSINPSNHSEQAFTWATTDPGKIIGAGPFKLEEYDSTNGIIHLIKNDYFDDWFGSAPNFEDVYFIFYDNKEGALSDLAAGTIDMVDAQFVPALNEVPNDTKYQFVEEFSEYEIAINQIHPYIGTGESCPIAGKDSARHVRQAISHAMPREIFASEVMNGLGKPGVTGCPPGVVGYDESLKPYEYDLTHALEHMALAGFPVYSSVHIGIGFYFSTIIFIITLLGGNVFFVYSKTKTH